MHYGTYKTGIDTLTTKPEILEKLPNPYNIYFENLMYRLVLHNESHSEDNVKALKIDFLDYRTFNPIWKDNTTINMGVEEKILFPVDEKYMVNLEKMLQNEEVNIILKSDYDERISKRKLSVKELVRMRKILDLYKTILQENERKTDGN